MQTYTEAPATPVHQPAHRPGYTDPDRWSDLRRLTLLVYIAALEADRRSTRHRADRARRTSKRGRK